MEDFLGASVEEYSNKLKKMLLFQGPYDVIETIRQALKNPQ